MVARALRDVPGIRRVELRGSRLRGDATPLSDWDLAVDGDLGVVRDRLPAMADDLGALSWLWDPLSETWTFMLTLQGPAKVDLIFPDPHPLEPPWIPGPGTLEPIDRHFWDWVLWLGSKVLAHRGELVGDELAKMHRHLLGPLGVERPTTVAAAVRAYLAARERWEARTAVDVPRPIGDEVITALARHGVM